MTRKILYGILGFLVGFFVVGLIIIALVLNKVPSLSPVIGWMFVLLCGIGGAYLGVVVANKLNTSVPKGETYSSLRWFFILSGATGIYSVFETKSFSSTNLGLMVLSVISVIFSLATLYIGIKLKSLIQTKSKLILDFLYTEIAYSILATVIYPFIDKINYTVVATAFIIGIVIQLVIIKNVKKLSSLPLPR